MNQVDTLPADEFLGVLMDQFGNLELANLF
jgi:hypothetical protein